MHYYFLQLFGGGVKAQGLINICGYYCQKDLSIPIPNLIIDSTNDATDLTYCKKSGSNCVTVNNFDVHYIENSCTGEIPYNGCSNDPGQTPLKIRVWYPKNHNYNICKLPAVILFHAGGYSECGSNLNPAIRALSRKLAYRGFVVFNVNYRVGVIPDLSYRVVPNGFPPGIGYTSVQQWLAIYRALQDARGAIRSILKMQLDGVNSNLYQIDVDKIFLGGMSAGSVLALSVEYFGGQSKIDQDFPGISSLLGSIDLSGVYYADPPATIGDDYFGKIKGILDCWGSLLTPVAYVNNPYSFFAEQGYSLPPIIAFHGMKDETFNYKRQGIYFSPTDYQNGYGDLFRIESRCLPSSFNINPTNDGQNADFVCIGSQIIYQMLRNNSIFTELYLDCQMAHGLDDDCGGCPADPSNLSKDKQCDTCSYQSDFGTGSINSDQTLDYIAVRAATFFQAILGGISTSLVANGNVSKFTECENKRVECNTTDAGGCRDEDVCPLSE